MPELPLCSGVSDARGICSLRVSLRWAGLARYPHIEKRRPGGTPCDGGSGRHQPPGSDSGKPRGVLTCTFPLQVAQLPLFVSDGKWHHICVTWTTRDGMWEAFQDGEKLGTGENLAPWHPIKPRGVLILGQEQVSTGEWETGREGHPSPCSAVRLR